MTRRWLIGLCSFFWLGVALWAQTPEALQIRMQLTEQLQKEAPGVLLYEEGPIVRRIWGVPFGYGSSPIDSALAFVAR